jgi:hypothetical protein
LQLVFARLEILNRRLQEYRRIRFQAAYAAKGPQSLRLLFDDA